MAGNASPVAGQLSYELDVGSMLKPNMSKQTDILARSVINFVLQKTHSSFTSLNIIENPNFNTVN